MSLTDLCAKAICQQYPAICEQYPELTTVYAVAIVEAVVQAAERADLRKVQRPSAAYVAARTVIGGPPSKMRAALAAVYACVIARRDREEAAGVPQVGSRVVTIPLVPAPPRGEGWGAWHQPSPGQAAFAVYGVVTHVDLVPRREVLVARSITLEIVNVWSGETATLPAAWIAHTIDEATWQRCEAGGWPDDPRGGPRVPTPQPWDGLPDE